MLAAIAAVLVSLTPLLPQDGSAVSEAFASPEARQFDFWIGEWDVNLRIQQPDASWKDSKRAVARISRILDGKAILELWDEETIRGFSLRYYDPQRAKWVLWLNWPSPNSSRFGSLEGSFRHGRGEFFSEYPNPEGQTVRSRYTFCDITPESLRWDDAFSTDGGKTWTHGWIMEFSRRAAVAPWPGNGEPALTYHEGKRCDGEQYRLLERLAGRFRGSLTEGEATRPVRLEGHRVLDGCAVMVLTQDGQRRAFSLLSYHAAIDRFEELFLDNRPGTPARLYRGTRAADGALVLKARVSEAEVHQRTWRLGADGALILEEGLEGEPPARASRLGGG